MWIIWVLAIIVFLIMEHSLVFWLVFVPLGLLLLLSIAGFFKKGRSGLSNLFLTMVLFVVIIIALVIICS